jgi:hypothetical protein
MSSSGPHGHVQAAHEKTTVSPPRGTGKRAPWIAPARRQIGANRAVRAQAEKRRPQGPTPLRGGGTERSGDRKSRRRPN